MLNGLTFNEYQAQARTTKNYPDEIGLLYAALGLAGEAGEVANKVKKVYRDDKGVLTAERAQAIAQEMAGCIWYLSAMCDEIGVSFSAIAQANLTELADRKARGVVHGDGDNR